MEIKMVGMKPGERIEFSTIEKRPNLEAITKKNFRGFKREMSYYSAINISTINETANILGNA